jgi:hypothetical protein
VDLNDSKEKKKKKIPRPEWWYILHPSEYSEEEWWTPSWGYNVLTMFHEALKCNSGFWSRMLRYMVHTLHISSWLWRDQETMLVYVKGDISEDDMETMGKQIMESVIEITVREIARRVDMPVNLLHYILTRIRVKVERWSVELIDKTGGTLQTHSS